jgi:Flp pilus assembly protein TadG
MPGLVIDGMARLRRVDRRSGHLVRSTVDLNAGSDRDAVLRRVGSEACPGHAVVELAFIITLLAVLSIGAFEFGGVIQAQNVAVQAAREGARFGMNIAATDTEIEAAARTAASPYTLSAVNITHPSGTELRVTTQMTYASGVWFIGTLTFGSSMDTRRW